MIIADLHIHTKYSQDSLLEPKTVIKIAERRGLNTIAITDHNTIKGALATLNAVSKQNNLIVIPGAEMRILDHDILCLFITEQPRRINNYAEFLDHVKELNAVTILAHPYRKRKPLPHDLIKGVDLIETFNARTPPQANKKARMLARSFNKSETAGSDAHLSIEIGRAKTIIPQEPEDLEELRKALLYGERVIIGKESPIIVHIPTIAIEIFKKHWSRNARKNIST